MAKTQDTLNLLRDFESRNVTFLAPDGTWPVVWERASGVHVWDADGKQYLDLTAAFGVAAAGHANEQVVRAGQQQMGTLLHAMGDVHPHALKAQLARRLSGITFERWSEAAGKNVAGKKGKATRKRSKSITGKTVFCTSGFEAVEVALKTAMLATGKPGVIAFEKAYHGLGYGALNATHRDHFKRPFRGQLGEFGHFAPFPEAGAAEDSKLLKATEARLRQIFKREKIGAVLVEPMQARGGINIPPAWFLPLLRQLCDGQGALLILDEIYTGFGRTGKWFACEHSHVIPDVICLGKALTGGFPLAACVGRADVMDRAWPVSSGEAIHTSTFLGHPVGCAMALAQIDEIERLQLPEAAAVLGTFLLAALPHIQNKKSGLQSATRGAGLMVGVELTLKNGKPAAKIALDAIKALLQRGYIFLPEGEHGNIISFTPPLTITKLQLADAVKALAAVLHSA